MVPKVHNRRQHGFMGRVFLKRNEGAGMKRRRDVVVAAASLALLAALGLGQSVLERRVEAQAKSAAQAPRFEVDPLWPKPLPNHWLLGSTIGVSVDAQDHVWIIHRGGSTLNGTERGAEQNPP